MSGYFQRLAQRSGLRTSASSPRGARHQLKSPTGSTGLEQDQVVEVTQPGLAAASHDETSGDANASTPPPNQYQTARTRKPILELHSESAAAAALPVIRDAATAPDRRAARTSPVVEQSVTVSATPVSTFHPKSELKVAVAHPIQSPHVVAPLKHQERELVYAGRQAESGPEPIPDQSSRLAVADTSPRIAQSERKTSGIEGRTLSRSRFVLQQASESASRPRVLTAIDVHIGTVAVEIHQAAPEPLVPPPPVTAPVARAPAPRERFSPSRHYIWMD